MERVGNSSMPASLSGDDVWRGHYDHYDQPESLGVGRHMVIAASRRGHIMVTANGMLEAQGKQAINQGGHSGHSKVDPSNRTLLEGQFGPR